MVWKAESSKVGTSIPGLTQKQWTSKVDRRGKRIMINRDVPLGGPISAPMHPSLAKKQRSTSPIKAQHAPMIYSQGDFDESAGSLPTRSNDVSILMVLGVYRFYHFSGSKSPSSRLQTVKDPYSQGGPQCSELRELFCMCAMR
jgi:hypothetical protein